MLFLDISGKGPSKLCENVITWFVNKYLPRHKLSIWVHHCGLKREGVVGWCIVDDCNYRPRNFNIEIQTQLPKELYIKTLLHEMQHVLQHVRGDIKDKGHNRLWKGINHSNTDYENQPWELEALEMEQILYEEYIISLRP